MVLFEDKLLANYTILIVVISLVLSIVIVLYFLLYFEKNKITENDALKNISLKYKLSSQEEKVLKLLLDNYTRDEIADSLYLSVNTVKNHIANIYKKTGMKKNELKEKYFYRTN